MSKIKIAVIGSCVSRDSFNSSFIKNYKEFYQCVLTQNHMSMISLISDPVPFKPKRLDGDITDFNKQILMTELTKGIWDSLKIQDPDYLILDFYPDVYFGVRQVGDSFITDKTWLFKKTSLYSTLDLKDSIKLEKDYEKFMELWKHSVDIFMDKMVNEFPHIKIIVNKIHFTDFYFDENKGELQRISETGKYKAINVDQINKWLDEFYQYFEEKYDVAVLEYNKEYYSDERHIWDLFYVHYTKDFYEDFTTKLLSVILKDLYKSKQQEITKISTNKPNDNLIRNSTFNRGNVFWSYWQDDFKIRNPEKDCLTSNILSIDANGFESDTFRQVWSHPIEINTNGTQEFTISFDIKVKNVNAVDSQKFIFSLRAFNKIDHVFQKDSVWHMNIKTDDIQNFKNNEWIRFTYSFKPNRSKFLKVGPYLIRNGNILWRNIKLEKGNHATEWIPSYKEEGRKIDKVQISGV
ncbi:DUF6270 domain-containing protein [Neobacillus drentensis]|uniref:DUF6270 domain-containing protein n=1 Tax=Neobacillus drentensis TaxID=220684 RepID=UPI0030008EEC